MPLVDSTYNPSFLFKSGFIATVYAGLFRTVKGLIYRRERIETSDGDFLDLDWSFSASNTTQLLIVLHGLEGNAQRPYMSGTAKFFNNYNIDAVCVNFRSCSGEENLKYRSYHSGATEDLEDVINHIISSKKYTRIYLKGFSLGGNLLLKYLGERKDLAPEIKAGIAVSVPCHLKSAALVLHHRKNVLYHNRFKKHLIDKLRKKYQKFPNNIDLDTINSVKSLNDFDNVYTSKAHGFKDAQDYYEKSSSLQFLAKIEIPTLLINAKNDSFLSAECFPIQEATKNHNLYLETPNYGGHVGFIDTNNIYYTEKRALEFVNSMKK